MKPAAPERECELRVAAARGERQREAAAETRVDVRDQVRTVVLAETLNVRRPDEPQLLGNISCELDQLRVANRHALDRFAALRLDHRARDRVQAAPIEIAEDVDRELLARETDLHDRLDRRVAEEELELRAVGGAVDVPRAETMTRLDEQRERRVVRHRI